MNRAAGSSRPAQSWRLVLGTGSAGPAPAAGPFNMAVDAALLETVQRSGRPVVRFYTWEPACLSLGRNQPAVGVYDPERARAAGVDIVRRPTGGRAVLHDRELTYCVLAPLAPFGGPRDAYAAINRALVAGLRRAGVEADQAVGGAKTLPGSLEPCFQSPAAGEVVARGRKLVGSAQRCEAGALLQHGSILMSGSQARVRDLLTQPDAPVAQNDGSITLEHLLGATPDIDELAASLRVGFEEMFGICLAPEGLAPDEKVRAEELTARFESTEWTWRR